MSAALEAMGAYLLAVAIAIGLAMVLDTWWFA